MADLQTTWALGLYTITLERDGSAFRLIREIVYDNEEQAVAAFDATVDYYKNLMPTRKVSFTTKRLSEETR